MKVAVIGAGISGLSCAVELTRLGIRPIVFEKTHKLGDKPGYLAITLRVFNNFISNTEQYLRRNYNLHTRPLHRLKEIVMISPNEKVSAKGAHGCVYLKGIEKDSIEHQLASHANLSIAFNTHIQSIKEIEKDFERIVVATGDSSLTNDFNIWETSFMAQARIATVTGNFQPETLTIWLNRNYSKEAFGYLVAKNGKEAELVLTVSNTKPDLLDFYWNEFVTCENLRYPIVQKHDNTISLGTTRLNQIGHIYFIGNSGGMTDDFLGFGLVRSIETGIYAARAIAYGLDFNKLIMPFKKDVAKIHEYRRMLSLLTNQDYDRFLPILNIPGIKQAIYRNPLYKAKYATLAPRLITKMKMKKFKRGARHRNLRARLK